ncbi:hypothetical protein GCM10011247_39510 [Pseudomonas plecoglossicida]|nr:hypothetical protein GCM10011247_39510 [Pseudomonas plecoglossicida]
MIVGMLEFLAFENISDHHHGGPTPHKCYDVVSAVAPEAPDVSGTKVELIRDKEF